MKTVIIKWVHERSSACCSQSREMSFPGLFLVIKLKLASFLAQQTSLGDPTCAPASLGVWGGRWVWEGAACPKTERTVTSRRACPVPGHQGRTMQTAVSAFSFPEQPHFSPRLSTSGETSQKHFTWRNHMICQAVHLLVFQRGLHLTHPSLSPWLLLVSS